MAAIYKREVKAFFHSFIGWLFLAVTLLMFGIYFTAFNMFMGLTNIAVTLAGIIFVFMLTIPILTMRVLAEDRKQKTDQLILTAPVTVGKIVLGKYLALLTVFAVPIMVIGIVPIVLSFTGTFRLGESYTALIGFFLYCALGLAIGMFLSSLTESIVIAAVSTFAVLFLGYLMPGLCSLISQTGNLLTQVLSAFDMVGRFDAMANGIFYVPSVVYFISLILFFLFCTVQSIQKRRYSVSRKGLKPGAYSLGMVLLATVLTVTVNILVSRLPEEIISPDITLDKIYTLTEDTKEIVSSLSEDITIYVLTNENSKDETWDMTIRKIADLSEHLSVKYIDPDVSPQFYADYADTEPERNSLIIVGAERSSVVGYGNIYEYEPYTYYDKLTGYDGEGQIVSALAYIAVDEMPKVYIVAGHDELELDGQFIRAIQKDNIEYDTLSLLTVEEVPADAQAVIIDAPLRDFSADDADKVISYLEKGGSAIIIPTWTEEELPNFNRILEYYGVSLAEGVIMEDDWNMYYENPLFLLPMIDYDEITESVYQSVVLAPYARGLLYEEGTEGIDYRALLETGMDSYSKTDTVSVGKTENDIDGPFVIAMKAEKDLGNGMVSNAVIVASELIFTEGADSAVPGNNVKLFSGMISALVEHESSVSIPMKYYDADTMLFSTRTIVITGVVSIFIIPAGCLITGFVIWFKRRRK